MTGATNTAAPDRPPSGPVSPGEEGVDAFLNGRLRLRQLPGGHRAGTDAVLLAAMAGERGLGPIVDVGAGVGTVGLVVALRHPAEAVDLVEIDPELAALAAENAARNGCGDRVRVVAANVLDPAQRRGCGLLGAAGLVLTNPPFFTGEHVRRSPDARKATAHVMPAGTSSDPLEQWLRAALSLLAPDGRFAAIHRPDALDRILRVAGGRIGALRVLPVYPRDGRDAIRILVSGVKGSRAPLSFGEGLVLHGPDGRFTPRAEALHRGEAWLA